MTDTQTAPAALTERRGNVLLITINRPEARNAVNGAVSTAVGDALAEAQNDPEIWAVVLTGAGDKSFCAGADLKAIARGENLFHPNHPEWGFAGYVSHFIDKPTIAAVNGPAIGLGLDVACMCDMRIASEKATFAESFVKVGIVPGDGGAWLLPRVVGMSVACEMSFTGDVLDAQAALGVRLVSRVVPHDELMDAARALAGRIAANPPDALRMTKRLLRESEHVRLPTLLELSAAYQALAHSTEDHREAVSAMLEKRKPHFTGR